ncbi:MAG: hypothetical protein GYA80_04225 [Chloroflexi bacterium]|nr:hypothetical protein [Chloroflexota bacterium]
MSWRRGAGVALGFCGLIVLVAPDLLAGQPLHTMAPVNLLQYAPDQDLWIVADQTNQQPTTSLAMLAWQTQIHLLGGALQDNTASRQHLVYQAVYTIQVPLIIR